MKLNQKGFTLVEGLLIVIALTLIVGVGAYVVNANKANKKSDSTNNQTTESKSESKPAEAEKVAPTLEQAVAIAKEYYQFRYVDKWNEQVPKEQLGKWLTPGLIEQLANQDGYQGGADSDNITQGGGFTVPSSVEVKGKSSDNKSATVNVSFVYNDASSEDPSITVTLVPGGSSWLISSAKRN